MKSNKMAYFDIETTEFCHQDQFILAATHTQETNIHYRLEPLEESIKELNPDWLIITYNGENYYGGFDIPFLRTSVSRKEEIGSFEGSGTWTCIYW